MSAYLNGAQLDALMSDRPLVDCTDDDGDGVPDAAIVADVIERASGVADGYFQAGGYSLPLTGTAVTAAVRHHVGFIAAHFAAKRRQEFRDQQGRSPYHAEYAEAIDWLKEVKAGTAQLVATPPSADLAPLVRHANRGGRRVSESDPRKMRRI